MKCTSVHRTGFFSLTPRPHNRSKTPLAILLRSQSPTDRSFTSPGRSPEPIKKYPFKPAEMFVETSRGLSHVLRGHLDVPIGLFNLWRGLFAAPRRLFNLPRGLTPANQPGLEYFLESGTTAAWVDSCCFQDPNLSSPLAFRHEKWRT